MMKEEFEKLTGIKVSWDEYKAIEQVYMDFDGDKYDFCKAYKDDQYSLRMNIDKLAQKDEVIKGLKDQIARLEAQLKDTEAKLEAAEEWKDHEDEHNVKQRQYEELSDGGNTRELDDAEAIELISKEWGFAPQMIRIVRTVAKEQINRFHRCRRVGEYERKPLYNATDWNYIRFDVAAPHGTMSYEMHNGELQFFFH